MSEDWNLHDAVEDGICDNAGHLALAGTLMAHSQRKQQLQALDASRGHQAEIAKTEAQRLEIEQQRLELEKLKQQAEKDEKEAVRLLRVLMAEVGAEFDGLARRDRLKGSPQGPRRDYAMAVLLSKLDLVRSRSASLSDLNDLKELSRLESLVEDLVARHFPDHDPQHLTRDKWQELEAWMQGVAHFEDETQQACAAVPAGSPEQLPSIGDLVAQQGALEGYAAALSARLRDHVGHLPADAAPGGVLFSELVEQAQLEDLCVGDQTDRPNAFAFRWRQAGTDLLQDVKAALDGLRQWQDRHAEHERAIQTLAAQLEKGRLSEAEATSKLLEKSRFAGLNYEPLARLVALQSACSTLALAKRATAARKVAEIRNQYPGATSESELGQLLQRHQKRVSAEKGTVLLFVALLTVLAAGFAKVMLDNHEEGLRLAAERERVAAEAKAEHERKIAEAKAKVEEERREMTRKLQSTGIGSSLEVPVTLNVRKAFCFIPSGSFIMGSPPSEEGRSNDENQVEVTLSQPFWLAKTEVTQAQWEAVMGGSPSRFRGAKLPVQNVSWEDAQVYIAKLNEKQLLPEGWQFALPTEAQWEYACRAGEKGPYSGGSLDEVGWYGGNSGSNIHEVGQKKANAWGLYDMHGNVWEWCADWYDDTLKGGIDPEGPAPGFGRVDRGGSCYGGFDACRSANRSSDRPDSRWNYLGFRTAIVSSQIAGQ